jgi:GNAT superfamily N-acetyltransferase
MSVGDGRALPGSSAAPKAMVSLRAVEVADYPAVAELHNRVNSSAPPVSAEMIAHFVRTGDPDRPMRQVVAVEAEEPVGLGVLGSSRVSPASTLIIAVEEPYRRRGIGTALLAWLAAGLDSPRLVSVHVSEDCPAGIAFAHRQAFEERSRVFPSVLDLNRFEPRRFARHRDAAERAGIRFATFAEVDSAEMRHKIHALQTACEADVPTPERLKPRTFPDWEEACLHAPWFRPDLLVLALAEDLPVALSYLSMKPGGGGYNWFTGVAADNRGHGLGTAIKVELLGRAKAAGIREVSTDNHSKNAAILAVNERLGYEPQPGVIEFMGTLAPRSLTTRGPGASDISKRR